MLDLAVIGAGPCGLAVGVAAKQARLTCSLFDKGPVVASLMRYPLYMTFFSTPEKLEIGGVPFVTAAEKPSRREALAYYRKVAEDFVLALTGYRADLSLLRAIGVDVDETTGVPRHDRETMQTNVPGVYIAGVLASGLDANKIFIENGREHGGRVCDHIKSKPPRVAPGG